jgi:O-antigen/teichoic acid export membrane protein
LSSLTVGVLRLGTLFGGDGTMKLGYTLEILSYGFKLYLGGAIAYLLAYSGQGVATVFLLPTSVAFLAIGQQLSQLLTKFTEALAVFLFPKVVKGGSDQDSSELASTAFRMSSLILFPAALALACTLYPGVILIYGQDYITAAWVGLLLIPGMVAMGLTSSLNIYYSATDRAHLTWRIPLLPTFSHIALSVYLLQLYGVLGICISFTLTMLGNAIINIFVFVSVSERSFFRDLVVRRSDVDYLVAFFMTQLPVKLRP